MKCYKCGSFLYENDYCPECGTNVAKYKHIVKESNALYNQGLEYARDRNLSGAIRCLEMSIKIYKANINARNLLGLVYVETGEYTLGLTQWVISKSLQHENNLADYFLEEIQNNRQTLNMMNSTIRKYNKSISYVQQGNYDLAEIQLKKLLNDNPNMLKGHQLLALLLIRRKKFAEARAALRKAERLDRGNALTISYLNSVGEEIKNEEKELSPSELKSKRQADKEATEEHTPLSGDDVIIPKSSYREYNPTTMAIIQIIIGLIVGAAIVFFVVTPAKTRSLRNEAAATQAQLQARIDDLEAQLGISGDTGTTEEVETGEDGEPETAEDDSANNAGLIAQNESYKNLLAAYVAFNAARYDESQASLDLITNVSVMDADFQAIYNELTTQIQTAAIEALINEGLQAYDGEDYDTAIAKLQEAYDQGSRDENTLYFLGRSWDYKESRTETLQYLQEYVEAFPNGSYIAIANSIISGWNR